MVTSPAQLKSVKFIKMLFLKYVIILFSFASSFSQESNSRKLSAREFIKDSLRSAEKKCSLGVKYYYGQIGSELSQEERDNKAAELYKESGTPDAKHNLADMYYDGRAGLELTQDERDVIAVNLLKESNTQDANILLGVMYTQARAGVDLSEEGRRAEAERLFKKAGISNKTSTSLSFQHKLKTQNVKINITVEKTHAYGVKPIALKVSPNGQSLYVANYYSESISAFKTHSLNRIESVINIKGKGLISLDLSPDGNILYVLSSKSGHITKINTENGSFLGCMNVEGSFPNYILLNEDGTIIYASDYIVGQVLKLKADTGEIIASIETRGFPTEMTLNKGDKALFVQCRLGNAILKIDSDKWLVQDEIQLIDSMPIAHIPSLDGSLMYVGSRSNHTVAAYNVKTHDIKGKKVVDDIQDPRAFSLIKEGEVLIVADEIKDTISLIDTNTMKLIGTPIPVGKMPIFIYAYERKNGTDIYVANYGDDSISKIMVNFEKISLFKTLFLKFKELANTLLNSTKNILIKEKKRR